MIIFVKTISSQNSFIGSRKFRYKPKFSSHVSANTILNISQRISIFKKLQTNQRWWRGLVWALWILVKCKVPQKESFCIMLIILAIGLVIFVTVDLCLTRSSRSYTILARFTPAAAETFPEDSVIGFTFLWAVTKRSAGLSVSSSISQTIFIRFGTAIGRGWLVFGTAIGLTNVIARKMELKFIFKAVNQFVPIMAGILSLLAIRRGSSTYLPLQSTSIKILPNRVTGAQDELLLYKQLEIWLVSFL